MHYAVEKWLELCWMIWDGCICFFLIFLWPSTGLFLVAFWFFVLLHWFDMGGGLPTVDRGVAESGSPIRK
jgi:hypothetical protein